MDRVNLFNPFSSPEYENRLTWAFLVFLKYDLSLQNFLRELVESRLFPKYQEYSKTSSEPANISTQTCGDWIFYRPPCFRPPYRYLHSRENKG